MLQTKRYAKFYVGLSFFLTVMATYLSLFTSTQDLTQGVNSVIFFVHVPAAWMSILLYLTTCINTCFFLVRRHPLFLRFVGTGIELGALFTFLTLITGCLWGKPTWGTYWVWDARIISILLLFFIYLGALLFLKLSVELASLFIFLGLLDIVIIKFSVNWWTTLHQSESIGLFSTSVSFLMLIPLLLHFANFVLFSFLFFFLEPSLEG
uniref:Putative cytochrome c biosynthesis ccmC-like mitochondrial protein n=1 Tax=Pelargonium citronellum TaxID=73188 RepID=A0A1J0PJT6_9ROSI|nr:cytochrome c biogenesis C [Pelargonium citronellum]